MTLGQLDNISIEGNLEFPCDVERLPNGNTIIADAGDESGDGSEIIEVNTKGEIVWRYGEGLKFAHSCKRLSNGNTLIADTTNNRVIEVTPGGEVAWSTDMWSDGTGILSDGTHLYYPNDAHELSDGTLLITDRNNNRFVVVDREGGVKRSFCDGIHHPHNADMLDNGNVLIVDSDGNKVLEIDGEGKIVWQYGDGSNDMLNFPRDADRLLNGNTLITDSRNHRVLEVNPVGQVVWEYKVNYYASFYEADRLPNGNTLISDQHHHQVIEVDPYGNIVWMFRNRRHIRKVYPKLTNGFFKKCDENGLPEGWYLYSRFAEGGGSIIWDQSEPGKRYPGLEYDRSGALCLIQYAAVKPGERYTFTGKIKTENVEESKMAYFQLFFLDSYGGPICNTGEAPKGNTFSGTTDWTQDTFEAEVPEKATTVEVRLFINGRGKVWMRDLMMFK